MTGEPVRRPSGLGRGLSALLGDVAREVSTDHNLPDPAGVRTLPIGAIVPHPGQPRRHFDEASLDELAASIAARGLIQPIVVRPQGENYQIVAGERRWRAAQRAQLHDIPAIVRELDDGATFELALIENVQRQDLNAIEEADAYRRLMRDYGHTQEALAKLVQKSRSHIANLIRLLELPPVVLAAVAQGTLSMGHARALITAADPIALATEVERRGLSVRETERLARTAKPVPNGKSSPPRSSAEHKSLDADVVALERHLADMLGLSVRIAHTGPGGSVTLSYVSLDQLDLICQRLSAERI